jgi:hypothetical protein
MPIRIWDISKKLGIEIRQVLAKAKSLGIAAARVPSSSLDKISAEFLIEELEKDLAASFYRGFRALGLGNFKAFAETQNIPIRPITLIFGANSAGKSSVLHGFLLARHAVDTGQLDVSRTEIGGDSVDLGGFRQYLHRCDMSRRVEWTAELNAGALRGQARQLLDKTSTAKVTVSFGVPLDDHGQPLPNERPWLISYEVESAERVVVRLSRRPDGTMHVDRLERETLQPLINGVILSNTTTVRVDPTTEMAGLQKAVEELIPTLRFGAQGFLPGRLLGEQYAAATPPQLMPIPKADRMPQLVAVAKLFIPRAIEELIVGVNESLRAQLKRICYLGPLRSFPPRHLAFSDDRGRNWLAGGGYAWDTVRTSETVRTAVNRWLSSDVLSTRYQLRIRTLGAMEAMEQPLADAIEGLPIEQVTKGEQPGVDSAGHEYDGEQPGFGVKNPQAEAQNILKMLQQRVGEKYDELVLLDLRSNTPVTHRDVGIGISQVLPVLVHAYADAAKIVAIEQPEIHLHPALQAELGDVFIESALGMRKNTFLIETHSEHLILRIMRRIRETHLKTLPKGYTPITNKDVSVLYVEPDGARSIIREMPLNEIGELVKAWPGGFFEEGYRELFR